MFAYSVKGTTEIVKTDSALTGDYALKISRISKANNSSYMYKITQTAIIIRKGMKLIYSILDENDLGKNTYVDFLFEGCDCPSLKGISENDVKMCTESPKETVRIWINYEFTILNL